MPCPYGCVLRWSWEGRVRAAVGRGTVLCAAWVSAWGCFQHHFQTPHFFLLIGGQATRTQAAASRGRRNEAYQQVHVFKTESERGKKAARLHAVISLVCGLS